MDQYLTKQRTLPTRSTRLTGPSFRIDWRQLTYYHQSGSFTEQFLRTMNICGNRKTTAEQVAALEAASAPSAASTVAGKSQPGIKRILNSLDGSFHSGQLSAILGPSGAGKSTFLSTLFGSKQEGAFGQTRVTWFHPDGRVNREHQMRRRPMRIAILPQQDHLLHHLSVFETLMFASKLKNADRRKDLSKNFHKRNVRRIAKLLKLTECLHTRCGKLSGGQYKRVSIGQELLSEPDVIILDEPTSGLDAMTCESTIQVLKSIVSKHTMSIILTIHQPDADVFRLFDKVYVIAQGGVAIYEGPPGDILSTLAELGLRAPSDNYNPARFIVENAFVSAKPNDDQVTTRRRQRRKRRLQQRQQQQQQHHHLLPLSQKPAQQQALIPTDQNVASRRQYVSGYKSRDLMDGYEDYYDDESEAVDTYETRLSTAGAFQQRSAVTASSPLARSTNQNLIVVNTVNDAAHDEELIDSKELHKRKQQEAQESRAGLIKRLNERQKLFYADQAPLYDDDEDAKGKRKRKSVKDKSIDSDESTFDSDDDDEFDDDLDDDDVEHETVCDTATLQIEPIAQICSDMSGVSSISQSDQSRFMRATGVSGDQNQLATTDTTCVVDLSVAASQKSKPMRRKFDKRLSAKHSCSKQTGFPTIYQSSVLTHRTWLSIVRDPVFFGIQACMHTLLPLLLAAVFGSIQDEGCPRTSGLDLVDFAYEDNENLIMESVTSIRNTMGNVGIVFLEMFVIMFAINCITALVFPSDMFVLLKEYRNGWYELRSYFIGRTIADMPITICLHTIAMAIIYYLTGQPLIWWRFLALNTLVIIGSLTAQSLGLTVGALLMNSPQTSVLLASGLIAPPVALSGFIVRVQTLPKLIQWASNGSYLYQLLNAFVILRYGYGRCECDPEGLKDENTRQIPSNLRTLASMWLDSYKEDYAQNSTNTTVDIMDKLQKTFKTASSYGHTFDKCEDVRPYAMLDFDLHDDDIYSCFVGLVIMAIVTRAFAFTTIYYKVRSVT